MLPSNNPKKWGVKVFEHECDSVLNYMNILNNGGAYKKYRELRENGIDDPYILVETLDAYAADKHYFSKIKSIFGISCPSGTDINGIFDVNPSSASS